MKGITGNKKFWKTLKQNKKIVKNESEIANIFNDYFSKVKVSLLFPESYNIDLQSQRIS